MRAGGSIVQCYDPIPIEEWIKKTSSHALLPGRRFFFKGKPKVKTSPLKGRYFCSLCSCHTIVLALNSCLGEGVLLAAGPLGLGI